MLKRVYFWVVCLLCPLAIGVRTWQLSTQIDADGFYFPTHVAMGDALGILCLVAAALLLIVGRYVLPKQLPTAAPQKNNVIGVTAMILALCCVVQTALLAGQTTSLTVLLPCFAALLGFTLIGAFHLQRKNVPFVVTVIPVVGEFVRLVFSYANFNGVTQVSEQVLEILLLCSFLLFCMGICRGYSGIQAERGLGWTMGAGSCTLLFGGMVGVSPLLANGTMTALSIFALGIMVFSAAFMASLVFGTPCVAEEAVDSDAQPVPAESNEQQEPQAEGQPQEKAEATEVIASAPLDFQQDVESFEE